MDTINPNFIKKSKYQQKINDNYTQCLNCERRCKIAKGKAGHCQSRINIEGIINTIVYGCILALSLNPIEKKPIYHFHPGSVAITIGTYGCNFDCFWCQNHHISHPIVPIIEKIQQEKEFLSPEKIIKLALRNNCQGTSISFNEPTLLFEYSLELFRLAKKEGLYNTYVSNGYMTEQVLKDLAKNGLDAINIDIKGDNEMVQKYCGTDVEKVWRNAKLAKDLGIHVEITTLLIDNLNSDEHIIKEIAQRISILLGDDTPFHITRFFPHYKSHQHDCFKPTSTDFLHKALNISKNVGLKYIYLGNLSNSDYVSTLCPKCSKVVIKRKFLSVQTKNIDSRGNCKFCGFPICKV